MNRTLPRLALLLGVVGVLPFLGCGLGAVAAGEAHRAQMLTALLAYGAVILSFLGGVHWGIALDQATPVAIGARGSMVERARLLLGVLPALTGWFALLLAMLLPPEVALAVLIGGFGATVIVEEQGRRRGAVPHHYMWMRWSVSLVVVAVLTTVLVLRLIGAKIIL
jgi:uncharacterized membrane protein YidH (DUF202 family)